MNENVLYECGVDFNGNLNFNDGDITLTSYSDNLVQAVINRLNTQVDEMDMLYESGYGSVLTGFLGWKATQNTLDYIKAEVNYVLSQEPRLERYNVSVSYTGNGAIRLDLTLYPNEYVGIDVNLVLSADGTVDFEIPSKDLIEG